MLPGEGRKHFTLTQFARVAAEPSAQHYIQFASQTLAGVSLNAMRGAATDLATVTATETLATATELGIPFEVASALPLLQTASSKELGTYLCYRAGHLI